jgi:hypothetical protein
MAGAREPEPLTDWAPSLVPDRLPVELPVAAPAAPVLAAASALPKPVVPEAATGPAAPARPAAPSRPAAPPAHDPPPGQRHRVVVHGDQVTFPMNGCAHCMRSPAPNRLAIVGTSPLGQGVGQRKTSRHSVPLCRACYRRATARTQEEKNARLNAHLISALVALVASRSGRRFDRPAGTWAPSVLMLILLVGYALRRRPAQPIGRYLPSDVPVTFAPRS